LSWNWYHIKRQPVDRFILYVITTWVVVYIGYRLFKYFYSYFTKLFKRHPFWQKEFKQFLDKLFFISSLFFVIFFFRQEWLSIIYFFVLFIVLFWRLNFYLSKHPAAKGWQVVNRSVFVLTYFLFILFSVFQYSAYRYYILDSNIKFFNIVLFRSWAMTMFWLLGFAVASLIFWRIKNRLRYVFVVFWALIFLLVVFLWFANVGFLYFTGLYINPVIIDHIQGSFQLAINSTTIILIGICFLIFVIFGFILNKFIKHHKKEYSRQWHYYSFAIIAVALLSIFSLTSFRNTPEYIIVKSFYRYFKGTQQEFKLNPTIQSKLERFGIKYNLNNFYLNKREKVFAEDKKLLSAKFDNKKPNVAIVFFESFSSRLTGVYDDRFKDLTPNLVKFAADSNVTVFKKYYNASTPTVTGLISQLCSLLPPTGHDEIEKERKMQRHHLLCLPKVLKDQAGYKYSNYITAVDKNFAQKDTIFYSMGVDEVYGTDELAKYIKGEPLSWGYSDHQMFPVMLEFMWELMNKKKEPFLTMLSTVDSHPPYTSAKDMVYYKDGSKIVLNTIHTTDHAFGEFWEKFKNSDFYNNTILVAVADHAIFPNALTSDVFPKVAGKVKYYDENMFMIYVPDNILPKEVDLYSSGIDFTPTLLHILNINTPNTFEGYSILGQRKNYPNLLGMHEWGLYISQVDGSGDRKTAYDLPANIECSAKDYANNTSTPLTLCEYLDYYKWKRQEFVKGRFWMMND